MAGTGTGLALFDGCGLDVGVALGELVGVTEVVPLGLALADSRGLTVGDAVGSSSIEVIPPKAVELPRLGVLAVTTPTNAMLTIAVRITAVNAIGVVGRGMPLTLQAVAVRLSTPRRMGISTNR